MKNQGEELTIDEYRLQLSKLQKEEEDLQIQKEHVDPISIYNIRQLPISISNFTPWAYFSLHYLWIVHLAFCYLQCFQNVYQNGPSWITGIFNSINSLVTVGYIINGPLLVLAVISILFWKEEKDEVGVLSVFRYIGAKIFPFLRYIIGICLYSTSFFAFSADLVSIALFILAACATIIKTSLLVNFTLRKDEFCCKSFEFLFFNRIVTLVSLSLGIGAVKLVKSENQFLVMVVIQALLGVALIFCYFSFGIYTYRHNVPRYLFFQLNVFFCSITLAMLFDLLKAFEDKSFNFFIQLLLVLSVLIFTSFQTLERRRRISQSPQNKNLKEKIFFLFNKFQNCDIDNEDDSQIRGILHYHFICGCKNPFCVVNSEEVYDSKKKKYCSINKIAQSRVSLVKFYIKCLLETAMEEDPQNPEVILDYLQFYFLKLKNVFVVLKMIIQLQKKLLNPIQRLRLVRLKRIMKEENNSFTEDLFLGKLSMQHTLEAEQTFETLVKGIDLVLLRNQLFWKYIQRNEVYLSDILEVTKSNFNLVDKLSDKWMNIAKYFDINRRWKVYYLCFIIYIKNQKLKPSMFQDLGNNVQYDNIFKTSNYFIDKTTEKEALCNPIMLFEQNTCFVVANCDQEKMKIKKVSNYFSRTFDYQPNQIIGSHLEDLMPPSIRSFHHKMFVNWAKNGKNRNENLYSICKVTPITKKGFLAPSFKFYKYYILNDGEIEYIAMFKRNKQQELIILTNEKFEIEAITNGLAQKFRINSPQQYRHFQGINLLILIPMLAKYTHYAKHITQSDEDFLQNDNNQSYFKKQNTIINGSSDDSIDILAVKKQLNLTNLRITVPSDFQGMKHQMKSRKQRANDFEVVRDCYNFMRKKKNFYKFKGELCVRQKDYAPFSKDKFYEIEINELQENNRLQKMKLEEQRIQQLSEASSSKDIEQSALMEVDMQMFLQLNKARNRVVLFPSDNIFIKEESNQAAEKISHITNISISIRVILIIFAGILLAILFIEKQMAAKFNTINIQFFQISSHQKMSFLLNTQYNIQQLQPGNYVQQSFYIVFYTHSIIHTFENLTFQGLLYDHQLNTQQYVYPYFLGKYPYPIMNNITFEPQDQVAVFQSLYQCLITLHRMTQKQPTDTLQCQQYHVYNNFLYSYYKKSQKIKVNLIQKYNLLANQLSTVVSWFAFFEIFLLVFCFLFIVSRLFKVTNGFSELVSIFIQMDNNDVKKISKFVNYVIKLFDHLKDKYNKMKYNFENPPTSTSYIRELQKPSSQLGRTQELMAASVGANLNKKIKKIELGNQIFVIKRKTLCMLITYLLLLGGVLSIPTIYSLNSLSKLTELQTMGFKLLGNSSVPNAITTGVIERFRKAQIFRADKYTSFFNQFGQMARNNVFLTLSAADNDLGNLFKTVYFEDFCQIRMDVFNSTFQESLDQTCGTGLDLSAQSCKILYESASDVGMLQRCHTIQSGYLSKGAVIFYNYLLNRALLYFNNGSVLTVKDIVEINDALKIVGVFDVYMSNTWLNTISQFTSARLINMMVAVALALVSVFILHYFFVEYLINNYLIDNYMVFRRMHEYLIPEFVINKEKIIKAKLVKEGFMKQ